MRKERSLGIDLMACLLTLLKPFRLLGKSWRSCVGSQDDYVNRLSSRGAK